MVIQCHNVARPVAWYLAGVAVIRTERNNPHGRLLSLVKWREKFKSLKQVVFLGGSLSSGQISPRVCVQSPVSSMQASKTSYSGQVVFMTFKH